METQLPSPKDGTEPPIFGHLYCGQTAGCIKMPTNWYGGRPEPRRLCVRWGPSPLPQKGRAPNFRPASIVAKRLYGLRCQLVRREASAYTTLCWMWTQLPPEKGHTHTTPFFGPCLLWPNVWMDEDAAWYGSRPRPRPHCISSRSQLPRKGHSSHAFSAHVYCGHGRPSQLQLLLSSCFNDHLSTQLEYMHD